MASAVREKIRDCVETTKEKSDWVRILYHTNKGKLEALKLEGATITNKNMEYLQKIVKRPLVKVAYKEAYGNESIFPIIEFFDGNEFPKQMLGGGFPAYEIYDKMNEFIEPLFKNYFNNNEKVQYKLWIFNDFDKEDKDFNLFTYHNFKDEDKIKGNLELDL